MIGSSSNGLSIAAPGKQTPGLFHHVDSGFRQHCSLNPNPEIV